MNNTVTNAVGIDAVVKKIQQQLYPELEKVWGLTADSVFTKANISGYGRVYKNHKDSQKIPEVFIGKEGDYSDSFYDDNSDASFIFLENGSHESTDGVMFSNKMKIVFSLDLTKCYEGTDRLDAFAHKDVMVILRNIPISGKYQILGYETELERIFSGFSIKGIENQDIHPTHVFAVLIDLKYLLTNKCT